MTARRPAGREADLLVSGRGRRLTSLALWLLGLASLLAVTSASAAEPEPPATAFVHVNVVPMDQPRVLRDQTVVVADGRITAIGEGVTPPPGARIVDGHGAAYLSPGLADMHTHSDTKRDLAVYLANGVTTVLNMGEASNSFMDQVRPAANRGAIPAPHVYAALVVDGGARYGHLMVTTPAEARAVVGLAKTNGYDFIKVYNDLSPECFDALIREGARLGMPVVGHGVTRVGLRRQLAAGQLMVAHTEEFLYTVFSQTASSSQAPPLDEIPPVVAFIKRHHAFVTADLNTYATIARQWGRPAVVEAMLQAPEVRYLAPEDRIAWRSEDYASRSGDLAQRVAFLKRFTKAMDEAGVPLIAGTDTPGIPGLVPGFSLHDDLDALVGAGLSPYAALSTATRTPGQMIARAKPGETPFGVVAVGRRADLVLTSGDPLQDLSVLRRPLGVMAGGKWYAAGDLQALLDGVAATYDEALR